MGGAVRRTRFSTVWVAVIALIAAVLVPIIGVPEAAHADPPAPSSITLVADAATFVAGDTVELTASTDVTVTGTGQTIRIFDDTTSTEFWGRLIVEGSKIEFHAFPLPNGSINVGTYYIPK